MTEYSISIPLKAVLKYVIIKSITARNIMDKKMLKKIKWYTVYRICRVHKLKLRGKKCPTCPEDPPEIPEHLRGYVDLYIDEAIERIANELLHIANLMLGGADSLSSSSSLRSYYIETDKVFQDILECSFQL